MKKKKIIALIRHYIRELAAEKIRGNLSIKARYESPKIDVGELEFYLFNGGEKGVKKKSLRLYESMQNEQPEIRASEVKDFETKMQNSISSIRNAILIFDIQKNGYSLQLKKTSTGIGAYSSGSINMGKDGSIKWSFSLQDGVTISTSGLQINDSNMEITQQLFSFYDSWQKEWRKKLLISNDEETTQQDLSDNQPPQV
jgi:hypothetical protein